MIIFVGDEPSKHNTDPNVAFKGTKSGVNLTKWVTYLEIEADWFNSDTEARMKAIEYYTKVRGFACVALGTKASERLKNRNIEHFKLPHPSPRNRKLNDKEFVLRKLQECKTWLNEQTKEKI